MKRFLVSALMMLVITVSAQAGKLFDYRGVFPADRAADAKITNYMLLKKASKIKFEVEELGQNLSDRIKISQVKLTSDSKVIFTDVNGIKELQLPETGIYEITLLPVGPANVEIRFVLKVMELETAGGASLGDSWKPDASIASAQPSLPSTLPASPTIDINKTVITSTETVPVASAAVVNTVAPVVSEIKASPAVASTAITAVSPTPAIVAPPAQVIPASEALVVSASESLPVKELQKTEIDLEAPENGLFMNPFNGLRFKGNDLNLQQAGQLQTYIRVFLRGVDGREMQVKGSFFSPEPDVFVFLPEKMTPGAVYTVEISDPATNQKKLYQVPVFPEVNIEFVETPEELKARIRWNQNPSLLPNPAGQVIALTNSQILVVSSETQLLQLDVDQNLLPFAAVDRISYRAQPFELELSVPFDLIGSECSVEVKAAVDGSSQKVSAFRAAWQNTGRAAKKEDEDGTEDYSDIEAVYHETSASEAVQPEPVEEIIPLTSLAATASFALSKSFSILESEDDVNVAWPHDVVWDESGRLWILDSQKRRVSQFSGSGKLLVAFGEKGESEGTLGLPVSIAYQPGTIFIADSARHAIHRFAVDGKFLGMVQSDPATGQMLDLPGGICFRKDEMWVADRGTNKIMCFNLQGGLMGSFGSTPAAPIQSPMSLRTDADSLFILEKSGLVKKFSPMGRFDATFQSGCREGIGFDVDPWGGIWVCDVEKFKVQRFSRNGKVLAELSAPPAPKPWLPTAINVRKDGKIAVTDAQNKMLHIFAPAQ